MTTLLRKLLPVLALLLLALPPASAQEAATSPLSPEDQALLAWAIDTSNTDIEAYLSSYSLHSSREELQNATYHINGQALPAIISTQYDASFDIITGEDYNVQGQAEVLYQRDVNGASQHYHMVAEIRMVEGALYVQAQYLESAGDVPALPEGWVQVRDATAHPELAQLKLEELLDILEGEEGPRPEDQILLQYSTRIEQHDSTYLELPAQQTDLVVSWAGMRALGEYKAANGNPSEAEAVALFEQALDDEDDVYFITLTSVDYEGLTLPMLKRLEMHLDLQGLDMAVLGSEGLPPGSTMDMGYMLVQEDRVTALNPVLQAAHAPLP